MCYNLTSLEKIINKFWFLFLNALRANFASMANSRSFRCIHLYPSSSKMASISVLIFTSHDYFHIHRSISRQDSNLLKSSFRFISNFVKTVFKIRLFIFPLSFHSATIYFLTSLSSQAHKTYQDDSHQTAHLPT